MTSPPPCPHCGYAFGGSHYHCARCRAETGMYGHYKTAHWINGRSVTVLGHMCCPDDCELVTCDGCDATSQSGWGDTPFCLRCSPPEEVCQRHQRTFVDACPVCP